MKNLLLLAGRAFLSLWAILILTGAGSRFVLSPVLFFVLLFFFREQERQKRRESTWKKISSFRPALLFSLFFLAARGDSCCMVYQSRLFQTLTLLILGSGLFFVLCAFFDFLFSISFRPVPSLLPDEKMEAPKNRGFFFRSLNKALSFIDRHCFLSGFFLCLLFYLPTFLYEFPGIFSPDSINQMEQVLGMVPLSNHHPVLHTLLIGFFYELGLALYGDQNPNAAVSLYTLFQVLFLAFSCAVCLVYLKKWGISLKKRLLSLSFYLLPFHGVLASAVWKDVPFAGIFLLFTCLFIDRFPQGGPVLPKKSALPADLAFLLLSCLLCLLRSNGFYAFVLLTPCLLLLTGGSKETRQERNKTLLLCLLALFVSAGIRGPLLDRRGIEKPDFIESCSIPLQQISAVLVYDRDLTPEERKLVDQVMASEHTDALYAPDFADNMKELVRAGNQAYLTAHKSDFLRLYLSLGLRHPLTYLRAFRDMTVYYWYPDMDMEVATIDGVVPSQTGLFHAPLLRGKFVVKTKELLLKSGSFVPLYGLLWSAGFYTVLLILRLFFLQKREDLLAALPSLCLLATLLIAVPASDFRYVYGIVLTLPVWLFYPPGRSRS